jgi:hypothetical protein
MGEPAAQTYASGIPDQKSDPTGNVLQLVEAAVKRLDNLMAGGFQRSTILVARLAAAIWGDSFPRDSSFTGGPWRVECEESSVLIRSARLTARK